MKQRITSALAAAALAVALAVTPVAAACTPITSRGIVTNVSRYRGQAKWHVTGYVYNGGIRWFSTPTTKPVARWQAVTVTGCPSREGTLTEAQIK